MKSVYIVQFPAKEGEFLPVTVTIKTGNKAARVTSINSHGKPMDSWIIPPESSQAYEVSVKESLKVKEEG